MAKRVKLQVGDIFEFDLDTMPGKGYGRILKIDMRSLFVELYQSQSNSPFDVSNVDSYKVMLMIWCTDNGLKSGEWTVIGHAPVGEFEMPDFITTSALTGELQIVRDGKRIPATEELRKRAQPYGIFGHEAVRLAYVDALNHAKEL